MLAMALSQDIRPHGHCESDWQDAVSKMIHNVHVHIEAKQSFAANISGKRYGDISCARFWSKPHTILGGRETYANAGGGGYLLSWQLAGEALIEQGPAHIRLRPGEIAVVDARRPMRVLFNDEVQRIVARIPANSLERSIPAVAAAHALTFRPQGSVAGLLLTYLTGLSDETDNFEPADLPVLTENICNLLKLSASRSGVEQLSSRELRQQAVQRYLGQVACCPDVTLDSAAVHLNLSTRLLQKILSEMGTTFTRAITEERLLAAARKLDPELALPIADVAYASGFNDVSHFNRLFKRRFFVTPSEYRANFALFSAMVPAAQSRIFQD